MTLAVSQKSTLFGGAKNMPVIRQPNFSDITCDIPLENFKVPVGNEKGSLDLKSISLKEYL